MACTVVYSCKVHQIGTLWYHNVIINDKKWYYAENASGEPQTGEEIKKIIIANCNDDDLKRYGFVEGWKVDCPR